jgi:hypothetical protein
MSESPSSGPSLLHDRDSWLLRRWLTWPRCIAVLPLLAAVCLMLLAMGVWQHAPRGYSKVVVDGSIGLQDYGAEQETQQDTTPGPLVTTTSSTPTPTPRPTAAVTPAPVAVPSAPPTLEPQASAEGLQCWQACKKSGMCDWCGEGMACCRADAYVHVHEGKVSECSGVGGLGKHECTRPAAALGDACGSKNGSPWLECGLGLLCESSICVKDAAAAANSAPAAAANAAVQTSLPPVSTPAQAMICQAVTGGTCHILPCSSSHGPTDCVSGQCNCKVGLCANMGVCAPPVPQSTVPSVGAMAGLDEACDAKGTQACGYGLVCDATTSKCAPNLADVPPAAPPIAPIVTAYPVPSTVLHWGDDCWPQCGQGGYCSFCGSGNACCRISVTYPEECNGITYYGSDQHHTCVEPVGTTTTTTIPKGLQNWGEDCWPECGKPGLCNWCGEGMACCRQGMASDPAICQGVIFGASGHHTCVKPKAPAGWAAPVGWSAAKAANSTATAGDTPSPTHAPAGSLPKRSLLAPLNSTGLLTLPKAIGNISKADARNATIIAAEEAAGEAASQIGTETAKIAKEVAAGKPIAQITQR